MKGGLVILNDMVNNLPPSEQKIAKYILANPEEAILSTAVMLGEKSETSSAAVIRLCKSLGFSGFQELKLRVAGDIRSDGSEGYRDIQPDEDYKAIIEKVNANTIQTLKDTVNIVDIHQIKRAVEILSRAKSIIIVGFGASYIAAKDAEQKFLRIGQQVRAFSDLHMAATVIANKGPEDVIIGISFSGETFEVYKLLQMAVENDCKTISITKYGNSSVADSADINLYLSSAKEAAFRSGATASRIAQLHLIDILFMCYISESYDRSIERLDTTRQAISTMKEQFNKKRKNE
ncbi:MULTISPECIES: MurR/RpiR family transcriptional regulator [Clostridia]|uniref:MurR/RpiR family transcriptional regulator n=1 Tax=Clostridia TaxID=186801 RepID=UPI000EA054E7|nr:MULTISPECIES: MurR/RpiR family transcriptional regulator [Clostridia]NBJ71081.1 MurR/RpiR family transcriptional regulator [Roseburia sp. 1XD42-34]RKI75267.1 MurR/RpiR family transcriptional regulator [Clostridium sp. 1xD42-85]